MPNQVNDPPSPQSEVVTQSTPNAAARVNAYTDPSLTTRNVTGTAAASDLPAPKSPATSQGDIREVYANDQQSNLENDAAATENVNVDPPPHAPNKWARGTVNGRRVSRDPYANNGMVGQTYLNNQGGN